MLPRRTRSSKLLLVAVRLSLEKSTPLGAVSGLKVKNATTVTRSRSFGVILGSNVKYVTTITRSRSLGQR